MMLSINIPIVDIKIMLFRLDWRDVAAWKPSHSWIFFRYHNIMEVEGSGKISEPDLGDRAIIDTIDLYTFDQSYSSLSINSPKPIMADLLRISV